ncbi:MAG TPA: 50S ribosomal protein L29 [Myxococcales bacterium LLY-WYZ-16_1]|jgi:large subunit ribosomal protein L29|nr:50S ribosomal protein L29 [Myxococcales bacterium LLY-WYZ-16_1]
MSDVAKAEDLRRKGVDELEEFIREKEEELFKLRFQHYTGQLENVARLKLVRREIARAKTVVVEQQRSVS